MAVVPATPAIHRLLSTHPVDPLRSYVFCRSRHSHCEPNAEGRAAKLGDGSYARRVTSLRSVAARVGQSQNKVDSFPWNPILPMPKTRPSARTLPLPSGTLTFLFTDIEGSTRLWEAHSEAMREAVARHDTLMCQCIAARNGHVFKTGGDAFYAAFATAPDALAAALSAQQTMRSERWPEALPIRVRMAVHTGAAEFREGDYFGPPLNQAARLLALGHGGQTLVSEITHDLCRDRLPVGATLKPLGEHTLRDLGSEQVFQLCHAGLPTSFPSLRTSAAPSVADATPSIAVLPFTNLSAEKDQEYFADGLAEELINVLSKIRGLRVASRTSAFHFKGKDVDIPTIAQSLNVATVLEGSVRKSAKRVRITSQLVEAATDSYLWSETYDRELEDIFAVQDDIAQSVVKELRTTLLGGAADATAREAATEAVMAAAKGRATDPEAYRLYLQSRYFVARGTREDTAKSIGYLKEALARDPAFAIAWAELATTYTHEADRRWTPVVEGYERGREAVMRALALEPELAEGHALLGWIQWHYDRDRRRAEASCRRALALAPGSVLVMRQAAVVIDQLGHLDEAIELSQRALMQNPLSAVDYSNLAFLLYRSGRLTEAEAHYRKALELAPQRIVAHSHLALVLLVQGRNEEAWAEVRHEPEEWARLRSRAIIEHAAGRHAESEAALQELIAKHQMDAAYQVAEVYAARSELDLAFAWLERAYVQRDPDLSGAKVDPEFRPLHADPRWSAFLRKMGFAD